MGPCNERWQGLFVPLTADTGLAEVHCAWGGVFVAEAIAAMRPSWHLLLSDTDVASTALFEIEELLRLCAKTCHAMCTPGIIVGAEPYQDINAGLVIFPGASTPAQPGCLRRRIMAARPHLLPRRIDPPPPFALLFLRTVADRDTSWCRKVDATSLLFTSNDGATLLLHSLRWSADWSSARGTCVRRAPDAWIRPTGPTRAVCYVGRSGHTEEGGIDAEGFFCGNGVVDDSHARGTPAEGLAQGATEAFLPDVG